MKQYSCDDCAEEISLDELKKNLLEMLKVLAKYCDDNGIKYYLSGGTLLGAIRHKGFIPWDDDIDINIPRNDCIKLQEISDFKIGNYVLMPPNGDKTYNLNFWRLYDESIILENSLNGTSKKKIYIPAFIDIFPIEGLPENDDETKKHYNRMEIPKRMRECTRGSWFHGSSIIARLFHFFARPLALAFGREYWVNSVQKTARKYSYDDSEYVGVMVTNIHRMEEKVLKKEYEPQIDVEFEGYKFKGPEGYDKYLSQLYGKDYMDIPPVEKRISNHTFKIYKRK